MIKKTHTLALAAIIGGAALFTLASNLANAGSQPVAGSEHIVAFNALCMDINRVAASSTLLDRCERWTVANAS